MSPRGVPLTRVESLHPLSAARAKKYSGNSLDARVPNGATKIPRGFALRLDERVHVLARRGATLLAENAHEVGETLVLMMRRRNEAHEVGPA